MYFPTKWELFGASESPNISGSRCAALPKLLRKTGFEWKLFCGSVLDGVVIIDNYSTVCVGDFDAVYYPYTYVTFRFFDSLKESEAFHITSY